MSAPIRPLANNPAREAVAAASGYSYQILQSVLAWVNLSDAEVLFLEGAEDFDHLTAESATVHQIKHTRASGNITLTSPDSLQAITNYWSHATRNPGKKVRLRYITTSSVGMEKGDPIGRGAPGIEIWQRAKLTGDLQCQTADLDALRRYLLYRDGVTNSFREFLQSCSLEEFRIRVIEPIDWDTAADESESVLSKIKDRLVTLGETRNVPSTDAEQSIGPLYHRAFKAATQKNYEDRRLTRTDLLREFDNVALMQVPKHLVSGRIGTQDLDSRHFVQTPNRSKLPSALRSYGHIVNRDDEVNTLKSWAEPDRLIPLLGPPWSGKSTIVRKFVSTIIDQNDGLIRGRPISFLYINLANKRPLRAFHDALKSSRDMPMPSMDTIVAISQDGETEIDTIRTTAEYIIEYVLPSQLHDRHLIAVLDNYSDRPAGEAAARELASILDAELFRNATTILETEEAKVLNTRRITMPALPVRPFSVDHAIELLVSWNQRQDVARDAVNFLASEPEILYPGILARGAARFPPLLAPESGSVTADELAECFLDEASRIVENVLSDLGRRAAAPSSMSLIALHAMGVMLELPIAPAMLDFAGLPPPPFAQLGAIGWIEGTERFQLARLGRQGFRSGAKARLENGGIERSTLVASIIRLCEACKLAGVHDGSYESAVEEAIRWLLRHLPDEAELRHFLVVEAVQANAPEELSLFLPDEEARFLPELDEQAQSGNFDAALSGLVLMTRSPRSRTVTKPDIDGSNFSTRAKKVIQAATKTSSIGASQLRALDIALYRGVRRFRRLQDVLELREALRAKLMQQATRFPSLDRSWSRWWLSWILNTVDLQIELGHRERSASLLDMASRQLRALIALRHGARDDSWIWWLRTRYNLLEARLTTDPNKRIRLLRQASNRAARCVARYPTEPRWIRFYLRSVRRLLGEIGYNDAGRLTVDQAIQTLSELLGPPSQWAVDIRAQIAALIRDEARRASDIEYQHKRAQDALSILRTSASGDGYTQISANDRAGLVEARILAFLGRLDEAEVRCNQALHVNPSGPAWELKLRLVDRQSTLLVQRSQVLDTFEFVRDEIPKDLGQIIREFKAWLKETNATDVSSGKASLWITRRLWASEGSIQKYAARLTLDREGIDFWRLSQKERERRLFHVYRTRMATLKGLDRRFGVFPELVLSQVDIEVQYQGNIAILWKKTRNTKSTIDIFNRGFSVWPESDLLMFNLALFYRYIWDFDAAIVQLRKVIDCAKDGELRRRAAIALADCLFNIGANSDALADIGFGAPRLLPDRLDALREARKIVDSLVGHTDVANQVAILRDHISLELDEEVNWAETDRLFDLLVRKVNGFPNVMIENLVELQNPGTSQVPLQLYEVLRNEFTSPSVLGSLGMLYLRRAEKGKSSQALQDAERAYALFNASSLLERSWFDNERVLTSVRRGRAILFAATLARSADPFLTAPNEGKQDQLALALARLNSAADRSVIEFRSLVLRYAKAVGALRQELSRGMSMPAT